MSKSRRTGSAAKRTRASSGSAPARQRRTTVADVCRAMAAIAAPELAQSWDNVGLIAGDPKATVRRVLTCIDLTPAVVDEGIRKKIDLVLAYHPPIFKPVSTLRADSSGTDAVVFQCIQHGMAVYATHTALDAADGGTNDVLALMCGISKTEPLAYVDEPGVDNCKLVVFIPQQQVDRVADAMFAAGAGHIGDYTKCSYRTAGQGTFFGSEATNPSLGRKGRLEHVDEIRMETIVARDDLPAVVTAIVKAHPYEEPAFDIYPLQARPVRGIGRLGKLPRPTTLSTLARRLKKNTNAKAAQVVGPPGRTVDRAIIVVGAAGSLPFGIPLRSRDVIITGEIRHHDALTIERLDCSAIALGHWTSERPVLVSLASRLRTAVPGIVVHVSRADREPFRAV